MGAATEGNRWQTPAGVAFGDRFQFELARRQRRIIADAGRRVRGRNMNESEFQTKLAELMGEITTLPPTERRKLEKLADETRERHARLCKTVSSLQESLDYLRLSIK